MMSFSQFLIEKPLTPKQRIQRGRLMKRLAPKMAMKRKITAKKKASPEKIKQRAIKQAKDIIRNKLAKDQDYNKMSYAAKIALDKKVEKKSAVIKKLSKKLIPKVKKAETERIKKLKDKKANEATVS